METPEGASEDEYRLGHCGGQQVLLGKLDKAENGFALVSRRMFIGHKKRKTNVADRTTDGGSLELYT